MFILNYQSGVQEVGHFIPTSSRGDRRIFGRKHYGCWIHLSCIFLHIWVSCSFSTWANFKLFLPIWHHFGNWVVRVNVLVYPCHCASSEENMAPRTSVLGNEAWSRETIVMNNNLPTNLVTINSQLHGGCFCSTWDKFLPCTWYCKVQQFFLLRGTKPIDGILYTGLTGLTGIILEEHVGLDHSERLKPKNKNNSTIPIMKDTL